jgi:hypothetical protein
MSARLGALLILSQSERLTGSLSQTLKVRRDTDLCIKVTPFHIVLLTNAKLEAMELVIKEFSSILMIKSSKDMSQDLYTNLFQHAPHMNAKRTS